MSHASRVRCLVLSVLIGVVSPAARADKWALPGVGTTDSAAGTARVTITPRALSSQLDYFSDATRHKDRPGQAPGADHASAKIETRAADGAWRTLWEGPLVNDVSPVAALVADDGARLVTFDNWHSAGFGDDVVVIYDAAGKLVRKYSLEQLLPAGYVAVVPRSVSSRWWRGDKSAIVDGGRTLLIDVVAPGADMDVTNRATVPLLVDLAEGELLPVQRPEWLDVVRRLERVSVSEHAPAAVDAPVDEVAAAAKIAGDEAATAQALEAARAAAEAAENDGD